MPIRAVFEYNFKGTPLSFIFRKHVTSAAAAEAKERVAIEEDCEKRIKRVKDDCEQRIRSAARKAERRQATSLSCKPHRMLRLAWGPITQQ